MPRPIALITSGILICTIGSDSSDQFANTSPVVESICNEHLADFSISNLVSLAVGSAALERVLAGAEHGTVLKFLENERRRQRVDRQTLAMHDERKTTKPSGFDALVPGLAAARERRNERRFKASQVDPEDEDAVQEMMKLAEDESIVWEEE